MSKQQISSKLQESGATWAVTSNKTILPEDGFGARPTYHVHPDASYPHQDNIRRFSNLNNLGQWLNLREQATSMTPEEAEAAYIYEDMRELEGSY